jgi:hypothetical protein
MAVGLRWLAGVERLLFGLFELLHLLARQRIVELRGGGAETLDWLRLLLLLHLRFHFGLPLRLCF